MIIYSNRDSFISSITICLHFLSFFVALARASSTTVSKRNGSRPPCLTFSLEGQSVFLKKLCYKVQVETLTLRQWIFLWIWETGPTFYHPKDIKPDSLGRLLFELNRRCFGCRVIQPLEPQHPDWASETTLVCLVFVLTYSLQPFTCGF